MESTLLTLLERMLHAAVKQAHPPALKVEAGPSAGPTADTPELLQVWVRTLQLDLPERGAELTAARTGTHFTRQVTWNADGKTLDFPLPEDADGELAEVEAPPDRPRRSGDDYFLADRTLHFYRPPAQGTPGVRALLRGARARGYQELRPCRLTVHLNAWAADAGRADALFAPSLAALLSSCAGLHQLEAPEGGSGVRMRLLKPAAALASVECSQVESGGSALHHTAAVIAVLGELELNVALGAPEAEGIIKRIEPTIRRKP